MDFIISFIVQKHFILLYLIPIVLAIKIYLFTKNKTRSWRFTNFFYFDTVHIISSRTNNVESAKKIQNALSIIILILALIHICLHLLVSK